MNKRDRIVEALGMAIRARRLIAFGGELKEIYKELKLGERYLVDPDEEQMEQTEEMRPDVAEVLRTYQ